MRVSQRESRSCVACDYEGDGAAGRCTRCGEKMLSPESFRRRGYALVILGLSLIAFMGALLLREADRPIRPGALGSTVGGTGGGASVFLYAFMGFFLCFGVVSAANGIWEIRHGRPHPKLRAMALAMFVVFVGVAVAVSYFS